MCAYERARGSSKVGRSRNIGWSGGDGLGGSPGNGAKRRGSDYLFKMLHDEIGQRGRTRWGGAR